ncbi:hypothetical protein SAMN02927900_05692 [Rhizobium mongolense subsp. loessense]|uniref:DUF2946 family protein n=1 Tax=Rhizobium mongolense subsp. loessense TaxID=158890 RepID=A0A1G4TW08_9HYPH|nr:hypothetical protein [Rhizobium mongolense]SCW85560.1 hypothetical protein SAMN02927900_05692 [Rhizobium mongolense subsp. loessense]
MVADRRKFAWVNAMLTILVALALLLAPAASAQAMQCHEHSGHGQSGFEQSSALTDDVSLQGGLHTPDHKACCAAPCGFCIVLTSMDRTEAPAAISSFLRFAWGEQTRSGVALPPTLGPPRLPV